MVKTASDGLSKRDVTIGLEENTLFYNPVEGIIVDPFWNGYDDKEILVRDLPLDDLRDIIEMAPRDSYLDELIQNLDARSSTMSPAYDPQRDLTEKVALIAGNPCWVEVGMPYDKLIAHCERVVERYGATPARLSDRGQGKSCVLFERSEYESPAHLPHWRDELRASSADRDGLVPKNQDVARFAHARMMERLEKIEAELNYVTQAAAARTGRDTVLVCRVSERHENGHYVKADDYVLEDASLIGVVCTRVFGRCETQIGRIEDSETIGVTIAPASARAESLLDVRIADRAIVNGDQLRPLAFEGLWANDSTDAFDRALPPMLGALEGLDYQEPPAPEPGHEPGRPGPSKGHAVQRGISEYLSAALDEYRTKSGWRGLDPETALETFLSFLARGECTVPPPEPDHLRLETPDGDLVALIVDSGDYRSICIDLEQASGRSGMVCEAEWVNLAERGNRIDYVPDGQGGFLPTDSGEPVYGSPFHTNVYDGKDDDCTLQVDFDVNGRETYYPVRNYADWSRNLREANEPLTAQVTEAPTAPNGPAQLSSEIAVER